MSSKKKAVKRGEVPYSDIAGIRIQTYKDIKWNKFREQLANDVSKAKKGVADAQSAFDKMKTPRQKEAPATPDFSALAAAATNPEGIAALQKATNDYTTALTAFDAFNNLSETQKKKKKDEKKKMVAAAKKKLKEAKTKLRGCEDMLGSLEDDLITAGEQFETEYKYRFSKKGAEDAARAHYAFADKAKSKQDGEITRYAAIPHLFFSKDNIVAVKADDLQGLVDAADRSISGYHSVFKKDRIPYDDESINDYCASTDREIGVDVRKGDDDDFEYKDKRGNWKKIADKVEWSYEQNPYTVKPDGDAAAELSQSLIQPTQTEDDEDNDIAESPSAAASDASGKKRTRAGSAAGASSSKKGRK